jgi:hypothetical protein
VFHGRLGGDAGGGRGREDEEQRPDHWGTPQFEQLELRHISKLSAAVSAALARGEMQFETQVWFVPHAWAQLKNVTHCEFCEQAVSCDAQFWARHVSQVWSVP